MQTILIPTDFSENSKYALEYGAFIAKMKKGRLIILHITKEKEKVQSELEKIRKYPFFKGLKVDVITRKGKNISKKINKAGVEFDADLIIMGSNGISNVGDLIMGSQTESLIRNSDFSVLTIKHKMIDLSLNTVLFPSDFSKKSYPVFKSVKEFSDSFNAKIHLLNVVKSEGKKSLKAIHKKMDEFIAHFELNEKCCKKVILKDKTRELGVLNYSADNDMDMIAIGSNGRGIVRKLVKESISHELVKNTFKPILTVRF